MTQGLPVSRLIRASVNLTPPGAQFANFDSLLIVGDSDVINVRDRIQSYGSLEEVAGAFGTTAPEYLAAAIFFAQTPQPEQIFVGRWASAATSGLLIGGALTAAQQTIANWTAITNGAFKISIDGGGLQTLSALDFSAVTNLNGVASIIAAALSGASCEWTGSKFEVISASTGTGSTVGFAQSPASGTDISAQLRLTAATGASQVGGIASETALAAIQILDALPTQWYGLMFAAEDASDDDYLAVAGFIEGAGLPHLFGVTTADPDSLDANEDTDIGALLKELGYNRSFAHFSTASPYAAAGIFGNAFTVNFDADNSTITLMYKQVAGVAAELLTTSEANALQGKNINVYVAYNNDTSIVQYGTMASGVYFDEVHGTDWLANRMQTDIYNLLFGSKKVPQTDSGNHLIGTVVESSCAAGVTNGLLGPGTWQSGGFGQLQQGDFLPKGYYVYVPPISLQSPTDRAARKSVPIQVAAKLAGAIHEVDILINVNR